MIFMYPFLKGRERTSRRNVALNAGKWVSCFRGAKHYIFLLNIPPETFTHCILLPLEGKLFLHSIKK